jgi:hypothetical protein
VSPFLAQVCKRMFIVNDTSPFQLIVLLALYTSLLPPFCHCISCAMLSFDLFGSIFNAYAEMPEPNDLHSINPLELSTAPILLTTRKHNRLELTFVTCCFTYCLLQVWADRSLLGGRRLPSYWNFDYHSYNLLCCLTNDRYSTISTSFRSQLNSILALGFFYRLDFKHFHNQSHLPPQARLPCLI